MKTLLRGLLLGGLIGMIYGVVMTERRIKREAQEREDAFFKLPEVIDTIRESERIRRVDQWINEIEDNEDE
jgi:hypothetical protein